ncbi:hypothetical protein P691DRAFT_706549 [Macrolepiota fuliginosa MF-IS2]|uniref:DUF6533 domain-containing protein n=1 Tax=Macrolepiota fuliginosa MF-IS2 TaxID=1400762 RepID=A0A9P6C1B2_9AGAR|nr:hypothetical protein P691DRAFT_706549 [Macrolepiota fuliginosa MF-IS2]
MDLLLDLAYQGIRDVEATRYAQLASSSIIIFDHLMTFDLEVDLIWKSSWSVGKILFIINRYYTLASVVFNNYALFSAHLTDSVSHLYFQWQGWTGLIACMIAETILQMRLYALYSLNKKILALTATMFIIASSISAIIMGKVLASMTVTAKPFAILGIEPFRDLVFCAPSNISSKFFAFWIPMLVYECLLCVLALIRGFQTFRSDGTLFRSGRRLVAILIRDSVLYFIVITSTYLTCLLVWITAQQSLLEIPIGFSVAMSCVLSNRVILNVRDANRSIVRGVMVPYQITIDEDGTRTTVSEMEMAQLRSLRSQPERKFNVI